MSPGEKPHLRINFLMGKARGKKHTVRLSQLPAAPEENPLVSLCLAADGLSLITFCASCRSGLGSGLACPAMDSGLDLGKDPLRQPSALGEERV